MKFNKIDKVIKEFVDYIGFYGKYNKINFPLFYSDNGPTVYIDMINLRREQGYKAFTCVGSYVVMGRNLDLFRIQEQNINGKLSLKVDLYGKGLLIINRDNLWSSFEKVLELFGMKDIVITRMDYTVDTAHYNFRKKNSLKSRITGKISKNNSGVEYIVFGRKGKSARFIRYYDKKKELQERGTAWLYPEYEGIDQVMRYELQMNSEAFDKVDREKTIYDLKELANFGDYILNTTRKHTKKYDDTILQWVLHGLRSLAKEKRKSELEVVELYLDKLKTQGIMD